jgi:hypothetical protein
MIPMIVDWPLGEDHFRLFGLKQALKRIVMSVVYYRFAVHLIRKACARPQDFASFFRFGDAG